MSVTLDIMVKTTETCGHCVDEAECSPVDGTCPTGCSAGYLDSCVRQNVKVETMVSNVMRRVVIVLI